MAERAEEHIPHPVKFRDDPHFTYNIERLSILFDEESLFFVPPFLLETERQENIRTVLLKWLQEFHFGSSGELETLPIVVNMIDRIMPKRPDYRSEPLLTLMSCYTMSSNLHDVLPIQVENFAHFVGRDDLVPINLYNSLLIVNDLGYNTHGINPIDFMRTFMFYLLPNPLPKASQNPSHNVPSSSTNTTATSKMYNTQATSTSTKIPSMSTPSSSAHEWSIERVKLVREDLLLKAVINYNRSLHSNKLATFFASEIAAACILWASKCSSHCHIIITPDSFLTRVPLLPKRHKPDSWAMNVQAAFQIVSKYSCADYRKKI